MPASVLCALAAVVLGLYGASVLQGGWAIACLVGSATAVAVGVTLFLRSAISRDK